MREELSSAATYRWKYVYPALWILGFGLAALAWFTVGFQNSKSGPPPVALKWIFPCAWLGASTYLIIWARRLRVVSCDQESLNFSGAFEEISVPLSAMVRVKQTYMQNPTQIIIYLDRETEAGRKITFIPAGPRHFISKHPITEKLEAIIAQAHPPVRDLTVYDE